MKKLFEKAVAVIALIALAVTVSVKSAVSIVINRFIAVCF